jgi:two-component system, chemotaxis family, sensor kinase CheA
LALDLAKYQKLFLEEAAEHLDEISHALLELEKQSGGAESIDTIFRMAHSIKSMAASLGYDAVAELAHALEDRMQGIRSSGRVAGAPELSLLFRGLEGLERMVAGVRDSGEPPPPDPALRAALSAPREAGPPAETGSAAKKVPRS